MRHYSAIRTALILLVCLLLMGVSPLYAEEYLPLEIGNFWSYLTAGGGVETKVISEMTTVFGQDVFVIEYTESPQNQGLVNFWTNGPDGDVFLHGFDNGFALGYEPPIKMVDGPLFLGKTWTTEFEAFTLPDSNYFGTMEITFVVLEEGVYQVGAGSFSGFAIGAVEPTAGSTGMKDFSLSGEVVESAQRDAAYWYSDGVGEIQYHTDDVYMLESYNGGTTPTGTLAWDGVKALFR